MDPRVAAGAALYAAGRYWDAHEAWEAPWRAASDPAERRLLQGLIQVAAAMHHAAARGDLAAGARVLAKARAKLDGLPDALLGVDLRSLREALAGCADELAAGRFAAGAAPRVVG